MRKCRYEAKQLKLPLGAHVQILAGGILKEFQKGRNLRTLVSEYSYAKSSTRSNTAINVQQYIYSCLVEVAWFRRALTIEYLVDLNLGTGEAKWLKGATTGSRDVSKRHHSSMAP